MTQPPRTLLISPFFDPAIPSGGVLYSVDVARVWLSRGRHVTVLCADGPRSLGDLEAYVAQGRLTLRPVVSPEQVRFTHHPHAGQESLVAETIAAFNPDVIHVHNIHGLLSAVWTATQSRVPVVLTALDFGLLCFNFYLDDGTKAPCTGPVSAWRCAQCVRRTIRGPARALGPYLPRWCTQRLWPDFVRLDQVKSAVALQASMQRILRSLDAVIAPSPIMADRLRAFGVPADRVKEVLYGVSGEKMVRAAKTPSESLRLAFLGNAERVKGWGVLAEAVRYLPDHLPLEIRAMGNEALREQVDRSPREVRRYVRYSPPRFGRDLAEQHAHIDAVLVPSLWHENSPFVVLESLAAGTPVIAADQAGIRHLVMPDHTGWLIEPGHPGAWARAMIEAVQRPARIRRMQANAHFTRRTEDFLNDVEQVEASLVPAMVRADCRPMALLSAL